MTDVREHFERQGVLGSLSRSCRVERVCIDDPEPRPNRRLRAGILDLTGTIEKRVIPSLVIAHARPKEVRAELPAGLRPTTTDEVAAFAEQTLSGNSSGAEARIEALRAEGFTLEAAYLQLLAPAAVHLRHLWNNDLCGFAEATLALWRIQQLLRNYSGEFRAEGTPRETGRRALLAPAPREKHDLSYAMFCLVLMSEFFRRDGWDAWIESEPTSPEFTQVVREQRFDVVEFLVSGDKQLDALAACIRMIRRVSPNCSIGVMVYGQVFIEHPELVLQVGADLTATDARQGVLQAERLLGLTHRS